MYVDEAGVEQVNDDTTFYIASGVIFHENDLTLMKETINDYKTNNFTGILEGAEIHLHDMYYCQNDFEGLSEIVKWDLINGLYNSINRLPMVVISACIHKPRFKSTIGKSPTKVREWCYTILTERFQMFLQDQNSKGIIRIDRTTDPTQYKLNRKDTHIIEHINTIRRKGSDRLQAINVVEEPIMLNSSLRRGLQIADAIAYCINKHMNRDTNFQDPWRIVEDKLRKNPANQDPLGYGLIIFPKR